MKKEGTRKGREWEERGASAKRRRYTVTRDRVFRFYELVFSLCVLIIFTYQRSLQC